jgi:hypothetical protein
VATKTKNTSGPATATIAFTVVGGRIAEIADPARLNRLVGALLTEE